MTWPIAALLLALGATLPTTRALAVGTGSSTTRTLEVGPGLEFASIPAALAAANAGDEIRVHGGIHHGPIVLDKRLALVGVDGPVIDGGASGTVVRIEAEHARLTGFVVRNSGSRLDKEDAGVGVYATAEVTDNVLEDVLFGIDIQRSPGSKIARNRIVGRDLEMPRRGDAIRVWESPATLIEDNTVVRSRDLVVWYSDGVTVGGNSVTLSRYGLHFMYASGSRVERNVLSQNAVGAYAMYSSDLVYRANELSGNHGPSGYGLALKESSAITITDNVIAGNRTGIYFDNSPLDPATHNSITHNAIVNNDIGLAFVPSVKRNVFYDNRFEDNYQQVEVVSSGAFEGNEWTVDGVGNFWSNYAGFDADGDGIGDIPHSEASLFHDLLTTEPALRLFAHTPAEAAIELSARAFPVFSPPPMLEDSAPLTAAPRVALPVATADPFGLALMGAVCVTAAAAVLAWARRPFAGRADSGTTVRAAALGGHAAGSTDDAATLRAVQLGGHAAGRRR